MVIWPFLTNHQLCWAAAARCWGRSWLRHHSTAQQRDTIIRIAMVGAKPLGPASETLSGTLPFRWREAAGPRGAVRTVTRCRPPLCHSSARPHSPQCFLHAPLHGLIDGLHTGLCTLGWCSRCAAPHCAVLTALGPLSLSATPTPHRTAATSNSHAHRHRHHHCHHCDRRYSSVGGEGRRCV